MRKALINIPVFVTSFFFYITILSFFVAFNFRDNPSNGWTLQLLQSLNGATISDVTFLDSLTGFYVTNEGLPNDTSYIVKTTNGGNDWQVKFLQIGGFGKIKFIDNNTGYACGGTNSGNSKLYKTTNKGENWYLSNAPSTQFWNDMSVLNKDTIWMTDGQGLIGGLFRTTDGGQSWIRQYYNFQQNPDKIYMVNKNLGFMRKYQSFSGKTTNGGFNWVITNEDSTFSDMHFIDSLTGWSASGNVKKTTDGGVTWEYQKRPNLNVVFNLIRKFSFINKDTIFAIGGTYNYSSSKWAGIIYKTTNGGINWGYQIPDTSFGIDIFPHINFIDKFKGWAFWSKDKDIYTTTGGSDTTFYTAINNNSVTEIPKGFELFQNYPNPFNQTTNIKYQITNKSYITLKVYDISGKEVATILNEEKQPGKYSILFDSPILASGIYFYQLIADGKNIETKKMIILK